MFYKLKVTCLIGSFLLVMFISAHPLYSAWWDRNSIPLPWGAEEVFQETRSIAGTEFVLKYYASKQNRKEIADFFRLKLSVLGWKEEKLLGDMEQIPDLKIPDSVKDILASNSIFEKDGENVMINFLPQEASQDGKTRFTIARGNMQAKNDSGTEDDFIPRLSDKPKVDIAPVYPEAALISLSENPGFMRATYFTKDNIGQVIEFYKNGMISYGWFITEEKPLNKLDSGEFDLSSLCPGCPKNDKTQQAIKPTDVVLSEFNFSNKDGDTCIMVFTDAGPKNEEDGILKSSTTIMMQYEKAGK